MTFRKRLTLSLIAILALFAVNLLLLRWNNQQRRECVDTLLKAVDRQMLLANLRRQIEDRSQTVHLLAGLQGVGPLAEGSRESAL